MTEHDKRRLATPEQTSIEPGLERFVVALIYGCLIGILIGVFIGWLIWG